MGMELKVASRKQVKIKIGVNGPAGAGKTMSALKTAYGMCGDWSKIALIDTENESASLYSHLGPFNTIDLTAPFSPERYIEAIQTCERAEMEIIIIDSGTQEWNGIGGYNDITDTLARTSYKGNNWAARSVTMPRHRKFIDYILQSKHHFFICNRSKVETVMGDDKKVKKIGMKEIQDGEFEYEFSIVFSLDRDTHTATATKDRTNVFEGVEPFIMSEVTGKKIIEWCRLGIELEKEKPLSLLPITDAALEKAMVRIEGGEKDLIEKIKLTYQLTESQSQTFKQRCDK